MSYKPEPSASSRLSRLTRRAWWLHSFGALGFGVGVMIFARQGLAYADKILVVLGLSWLLMFVALRFIVGPSNRTDNERIARKGVRVVTNYVIKNLYQQMFFFLVPLYASSATWSLASPNWWLAPLLLFFAVLSTMDVVFDNVVMEHRVVASLMYGVALFGVLNLVLPMVFGLLHFAALLIASGATAPAVALLNFPVRSVFSARGIGLVIVISLGLLLGAWYGRVLVPPTPLSLAGAAVGHGTYGSYECLPGGKASMAVDQLDGLRCASEAVEPGGVREPIVHVWLHNGSTVFRQTRLEPVPGCAPSVLRSIFPKESIPEDPRGKWVCSIETSHGQLIGRIPFAVVAKKESTTP